MFFEINKSTGLINLNKIDRIEKNNTKGFIQNPDGTKEECDNYHINFIKNLDNGGVTVYSKHFDTELQRDTCYENLKRSITV